MIWKEKEGSRIMAVSMDNLRDFLDITRMDKVPNVRIRELCRMMKGLMKLFSDDIQPCGENGKGQDY